MTRGVCSVAMSDTAPMTTTMNELSESARSAPCTATCARPDDVTMLSAIPRPSTAPAERALTQPIHRRPRNDQRDDARHKSHRGNENGSASVVQLSHLIDLEGSEAIARVDDEHLKDHDDEQHVEGRTEFHNEWHARREEKGDECDAVVDEQQADNLRDGATPRHQEEVAHEHGRHADRD